MVRKWDGRASVDARMGCVLKVGSAMGRCSGMEQCSEYLQRSISSSRTQVCASLAMRAPSHVQNRPPVNRKNK